MTTVNGEEVGRMLYDGFGAVLTNTLPLTLTGTLPDVPDTATGLVHLGGGRWYDPALGRPLQPNPMGGPPTLPQALNRYAATALGQPGVYQAAVSNPLLQASLNQVPELALGKIAQDLSSNLASSTVYRVGFTGYGIVQAQGTARQIAALQGEWTVTSSRLASEFFRKIRSVFSPNYKIQTAQGRVFIGKNLQYLDEYAEGLGFNGVQVLLLKREVGSVVDDAATLASRKAFGEAAGVGMGGLVNAGLQYANDYDNPYLTGGQKGGRALVSGFFGIVAGGTGVFAGAFSGPAAPVVTPSVAFSLGVYFELNTVPRVFEFFGIIPTRDLHPLVTP